MFISYFISFGMAVVIPAMNCFKPSGPFEVSYNSFGGTERSINKSAMRIDTGQFNIGLNIVDFSCYFSLRHNDGRQLMYVTKLFYYRSSKSEGRSSISFQGSNGAVAVVIRPNSKSLAWSKRLDWQTIEEGDRVVLGFRKLSHDGPVPHEILDYLTDMKPVLGLPTRFQDNVIICFDMPTRASDPPDAWLLGASLFN